MRLPRSVLLLALLLSALLPAVASAAPAPTGPSAGAFDARVELAWKPAPGASAYAVYRGSSAATVTTRVTPAGGVLGTSFTDASASNGATYYYAVRSIEAGFESPSSLLVQATPRARSCTTGNPIVLENCLPGNASWNVRAAASMAAGGIEGFATAQSIDRGQTVDLKVNSGASFDVEVYRTGSYGGLGARLYSTQRGVPGTAQPACQKDAGTGLTDCSGWSVSTALATTAAWPSGMYLLRLVRTDNGADTHVLLALRDDAAAPDVVFGSAFTTFQAYNSYGGKSLYDWNSIGANTVAGTTRAVKVSFDRPYEQTRIRQHDWFTDVEQPAVAWLERNGYDIRYIADSDLERTPALARAGRAYYSPAHDEYYSNGMRAALEQARDAGDGLLFSGANAIFWRVRFEGAGDRVMAGYKTTEGGAADPSGLPTTTWRDPAGANRPENALIGQMYIGQNATGSFPLRVSAAQGADRLFRYTGLDEQAPGATAALGQTLVGWEWDARVANGQEPAGVKTLASSAVSGSLLTDAGRVYAPGNASANVTKYKAASGALVLSTGTNDWWRGLGRNVYGDGEPLDDIAQITVNALADMGARATTPAAGVVLDTPPDAVPRPTGVTASAVGTDTVALSWTPVAGATGYSVYRSRTQREDGYPLGTRANSGALTTASFTDSGLAPATSYHYVVTATVGGVQSAPSSEVAVTTPANGPSSIRINTGGGQYTSSTGATWLADRNFTGGATWSIGSSINGTSDPALHQDERWGSFSYAIAVPNGTYDVRLHFAELYFGVTAAGGAGKRVFDVDVLDTTRSPDIDNLDIFAEVGARAALSKTISGVAVGDGTLNLRTIAQVDDPELTAIEIIPGAQAGAPTVTQRSPSDGATGVVAAARPSATFSRAMDPATLTASTFTLRGPGGTLVPASVSYDGGAASATLTPSAPLAYSTSYTATLSTAVRAADGQALAAPVGWTFTTQAAPPPDTQAPTVAILSPAAGATVSGDVAISATADDDVGVTGVQFKLDGANLGGEDTSAPYGRSWSSFDVSDGAHAISAVARDAAGNTRTSAVVSFTVDNPAVDPTGLVAAYGFEEASGSTVTDQSSAANNGTITAAARTDEGRFGRALSFDGAGDHVSVPDSSSLDLTNGMTLEAWVHASELSHWNTLVLKERTSNAMSYGMYANAGNNRPSGHVSIGGSESDTRGPAQLPTGQWTHLATTYDGTTLRLYRDGQEIASRALGGALDASSLPLRIGGNVIWGEWFSGRIDEVRVYRRALSAAELRTDMESPVRPDTPPSSGPEVLGEFSPPTTWPLVPVHISMLSNGKVAVWDGFDAALNSERVWDPATGTFTPIPTGRNLFCAAHVTLPDGRMFVAGGHVQAYEGLKDTHLFNPATNQWFRGSDMARARWYPTATTLPDGRVLVVSGDNVTLNQPGQPVPLTNASDTLPEIYDVDRNQWTSIPTAQRRMPLYPFMFVLPNGKVLDAGPDLQTRTLDLGTGQWTAVGSSAVDGHSAVMYRPGKILKSGTWADPEFPGKPVTNRAAAIDMTAASPAWREAAPMLNPRAYHTLTALPDGTVLATGGATATDGVNPANAVLAAEIWDPVTDTWKRAASGTRPRLYHSSAVLLPDGRVLLAGGGAFGGAQNETNAEIYSPPYLFKGARPTITTAPASLRYGQSFSVGTPDAAKVQSVALVRMGSVTHNFDMDQRFMHLNATTGGASTLNIDAPANANVAPPGYYMLFVVDDKGVPSVSKIIRVEPAAADTQAPTAPGALSATVQDVDDVRLDWTAASDDRGVAEYRVHRSTTAGFTPSAGNRIATVASGTTHTDSNLAPATYHYKVLAVDAAGNVGPASPERSATITADTTAPTVAISAPAQLATVGGTVTVAASASDDRAVTSVQFRLDGANLGSAQASAPYSVPWDTRAAANGQHTLTAVARDAAGNSTTSADVRVTVDNGAPPTVALTAPAAGATVSATVSVTADAADDRGVANVQFKLDGADLGAADASAPYAVSWNTTTATNGTHSLTAVARDGDGNTVTSAARQVTVANATPPPGGLVAAYGFEETTGTTVTDASPNALTGTITGATRSTSGRFGRALAFDGVNDWVTVPDAAPLDLTTGMTLEAWVNPTASTGWRTALLKEQAGGLLYALYANTDAARPSGHVFSSAEFDTSGTAQLPLNTWTHLSVTYDGAAVRLFVNGVQASTKPTSGALATSNLPLRMGGNNIWSEWFRGSLDEVRVYNRALSAAEIGSDMGRAVVGG